MPFKKGHKINTNRKQSSKHIVDRMISSKKFWFKKGQPSVFKGKKRLNLQGENNGMWKGGISELTERIRHCFEYRQWRSDVFTRDYFTCQNCGIKGTRLEAHHIKEFYRIIEEYNIKTLEEALNCEELWNINNGHTLCKKCHNKTKPIIKDE